MAMTIASLGRSTKIAESMGLGPFYRRRHWRGLNRLARTDALDPFDDDLLAAFETVFDDSVRAALSARLHSSDRDLAVFDDEHIDALLIRNQRGLRDHDFFLRLADLH